jgi:hypothetical protein
MTYRSPARKRFVKPLEVGREGGREGKERGSKGRSNFLTATGNEPVLVLEKRLDRGFPIYELRVVDRCSSSRAASTRQRIDHYRIIDSALSINPAG